MRTTIITAALLAALGVAAMPASAAPIGPGAAVAAPADMISTVQMDRMERHMMRHEMRREMRHRMMRREMMHRM